MQYVVVRIRCHVIRTIGIGCYPRAGVKLIRNTAAHRCHEPFQV